MEQNWGTQLELAEARLLLELVGPEQGILVSEPREALDLCRGDAESTGKTS